MQLLRLLKIIFIFKRYNLHKLLLSNNKTSKYYTWVNILLFFIPTKYSHNTTATNLRLAFEYLGPIFVKFGQLLSTRPDLLSDDYTKQLSLLQSSVPPFPEEQSIAIIEASLKSKISDVFVEFDYNVVAAASIAQVHKAKLHNNLVVAIKVKRPNIHKIIKQDISLMYFLAKLAHSLFAETKRLRVVEIIAEFDSIITAELDFFQEAANATELARLHRNDKKIIMPQIYHEYSSNDIIVMQWMDGIPISDINKLREANVDLVKLSHAGVEIFYTQVFNYGFFHADMHPGNILCSSSGQYIALDFGIVGSLSEADKRYLAINILAFFNRDYKKVALAHVESGWAPDGTNIEQFENAIRTVCEPIFDKPLAEISFAQVLIKLFQVSRKFGIQTQPQLILLQKTIVNVEGLGRLLNPELDLWKTAKPILHKWLSQQMGIRGFFNQIKSELPYWSYTLPYLPRKISKIIDNNLELSNNQNHKQQQQILTALSRQNKLLIIIIVCLILFIFYRI